VVLRIPQNIIISSSIMKSIMASIILNDLKFYRTAIVVYQLFYRMVLGQTFDAGAIIKFLSQVSLGAYVGFLY
jgi:hypothetical protein